MDLLTSCIEHIVAGTDLEQGDRVAEIFVEPWVLQLIQEHTTLEQECLAKKAIVLCEWLPPKGRTISSSENEISEQFEENALLP